MCVCVCVCVYIYCSHIVLISKKKIQSNYLKNSNMDFLIMLTTCSE